MASFISGFRRYRHRIYQSIRFLPTMLPARLRSGRPRMRRPPPSQPLSFPVSPDSLSGINSDSNVTRNDGQPDDVYGMQAGGQEELLGR